VLRAANELNDFCAHENPSHTAMATNPTKASEIRYAVMLASHLLNSSWARLTTLDTNKNMRHDRFAIISGANPIPPGAIRMADRRGGAAADVDVATPRAGAFARAGQCR
jgi:hypothetical protein